MTFYAGPERGALALVESPAQLLNVIELAQHEDDLAAMKIAVLAPNAGITRTQLRSMIALAREIGHQGLLARTTAGRHGCCPQRTCHGR